jgi:type IV pilus assembly protein PilP
MTHTDHRHLRIALAAALLFAFVAGGCGEEKPAPAPVVEKTMPKAAAKAAEAAQPVAVAVAKPSPVALYSPAGKRDPFIPFLKLERKGPSRDTSSLPPLQRYELGELRFVGVIWGPAMARALVEDAEGKGYTVSVGTKMGRNEGVVTRITNKEIFVREEFRDYTGSKVRRESSLKLQTGGEK